MQYYTRDAGGGGAGGACAPPSFGISVNPIRTKGGRLCPLYYYVPPHLFGRCGVSVIEMECDNLMIGDHQLFGERYRLFFIAEDSLEKG